MPQPWNNWFHCTCNTFGAWLPGDSRGWDTRRHREHIGGCSSERSTRFAQLPTRPVVHLPDVLRQPILCEFVTRLLQEEMEAIIASLDDHHLHILIRVRDHQCRHWLGIAKKHTSLWLRQNDHIFPGGIWARRSRAEPIRSRQHQLNTYGYILAHQQHGAALWRPPAAPAAPAARP